MRFHQGRLLDHVHIRVADIEASKTLYGAVFHGPSTRSAASVEVEPA